MLARRTRAAAIVWLTSISVMVGTLSALADTTLICDSDGRCTLIVVTPATPGGDGGSNPGTGDTDEKGTRNGKVDPCTYKPVEPTPEAGDPRWQRAGGTPETGTLYTMLCPDSGGNPIARGSVFAPNGTPPEVVAPDPTVAGQMAVDALQITTPTVHMDPEDAVAVNFWTVLWAGDSDAPDPAVASAQGVTATARAELVSVTWDMGEPAAAPWRDSGTPSIGGEQEQRWPEGCALDQGSATVRFTCQSAGSPASGATLLAGEQPLYPAYGFMYRWISKPDRTGGSGTWSVTATTTWRVTWSTDSGYVGAPLIRSFQSATFQVSVGEFRTAGGGG